LNVFWGAAELAQAPNIRFLGGTTQPQLKNPLPIPPIAADAVGQFLAGNATPQRTSIVFECFLGLLNWQVL